MFGLMRWKTDYEQQGLALYQACLDSATDSALYKAHGLPDTFTGRFDVLTLHISMVTYRMKDMDQGEKTAQAMFDVTFAACDQMLREMGIGDMGVPKHMKKMMTAFHGRMDGYFKAFEDGKQKSLADAVMRNVYATVPDVSDAQAKKFAKAVTSAMTHLGTQADDDIAAGRAEFQWS
jgi:cytochrome b pre-mRNA-processing protein 3